MQPNEKQSKPGESWPEKLIAMQRLISENQANVDEYTKYFIKTRDNAQTHLDALNSRISQIVGPDSDDVSNLDEENTKVYSKLAGIRREYQIIYLCATEMLDRLELTVNNMDTESDDKPDAS